MYKVTQNDFKTNLEAFQKGRNEGKKKRGKLRKKGERKKRGRKGEKEEKKDRSTKNKGIMVCKESEMESKKDD